MWRAVILGVRIVVLFSGAMALAYAQEKAAAYSESSCIVHDLNANLKTSRFQVSPKQFDKNLKEIEAETSRLIHALGISEEHRSQLSPNVLGRIALDQERLQSLMNHAMAKRPPDLGVIHEVITLNQRLNPLHRVAAIDDRMIAGSNFVLIKMDSELTDRGVQHLSEEDRAKYELKIIDGKFYDSLGKLFNTSKESPGIYVMDGNGRIYAAEKGIEGVFHHSSFFAGGPVAAAGQFVVRDGVILRIDDRSGHYLPPRIMTEQFIAWLEHQGVHLTKEQVDFVAPPETASPPK